MSQKLALIIGNSEYEDGTLARLVTPDADANTLAQILRDQTIGGFDEVTALVNQPSTTIRRAISSFFVGRGRDDLLLLYFSGHGIQDDRGQLFLAVKDTEHSLLRGTAIPAAFITEEMDNSRSRRQVLILDCCHSGSFSRGMKGAPGISVGTAAAFEGTGFGRVVLTATDSTQYAWEGDRVVGQADNSVFTQHLIQGLQSGLADTDGDGRITLDELYDYVYEKVVTETPKQTPSKWSYGQQGEMVIARNVHPVVKPADLPPDLQQTLDDSRPWVREGAVRELDRLMRGSHPGLALAAREALNRLADDDSRRVAAMAADSLAAYAQSQASIEVSETGPEIAHRKIERQPEERLAAEKEVETRSIHAQGEGESTARQPQGEARRANSLARILSGFSRMPILLIATGWGIGGLVSGTANLNQGSWFITSALVGAVGGLATGLALQQKRTPIYWKPVLLITLGWLAGFVIDGGLGNSFMDSSFAKTFANKYYETFSSWDLAFIIIRVIGGTVFGAIDGIIGGLAIGLVLRQTQPSIQRKQIIMITIGWAIVWAIGSCIYWAIILGNNASTNSPLSILSLSLLLAAGAAIAGLVTLRQLGQAGKLDPGGA